MNDKPIIFSAPMVRAILEDRKTQTRRIIKPQPDKDLDPDTLKGAWEDGFIDVKCPYGKIGDLLWVRESFYEPRCDGTVIYRANWKKDAQQRGFDNIPDAVDWKWKPSIHMPRWASRITLQINDIRIERIQDISERAAKAEGARPAFTRIIRENWPVVPHPQYVWGFEELWESINGKGSWNENPWVWVIHFGVHKQNVDKWNIVA